MIRRLAGWAMVTSACCGVAALISWSAFRPHLLPGGWLMLAAGVLCVLGLAAPDETEEQRQYRHAQRHPVPPSVADAITMRARTADVLDQAEWIINAEAARIQAEMQPMFDFDDTEGPWPA